MACLMNYREEELGELQSPLLEARARVERQQIGGLHDRCVRQAPWSWLAGLGVMTARHAGDAACACAACADLRLAHRRPRLALRPQAVQQRQRRAAGAQAGRQAGGHAVGGLHGQLALLLGDGAALWPPWDQPARRSGRTGTSQLWLLSGRAEGPPARLATPRHARATHPAGCPCCSSRRRRRRQAALRPFLTHRLAARR